MEFWIPVECWMLNGDSTALAESGIWRDARNGQEGKASSCRHGSMQLSKSTLGAFAKQRIAWWEKRNSSEPTPMILPDFRQLISNGPEAGVCGVGFWPQNNNMEIGRIRVGFSASCRPTKPHSDGNCNP